tara:strand:- start:534 stop:770 length:237 start_codon:yes stop_codon:yes gene_type:complete
MLPAANFFTQANFDDKLKSDENKSQIEALKQLIKQAPSLKMVNLFDPKKLTYSFAFLKNVETSQEKAEELTKNIRKLF